MPVQIGREVTPLEIVGLAAAILILLIMLGIVVVLWRDSR